jgi:hypothetical protein
MSTLVEIQSGIEKRRDNRSGLMFFRRIAFLTGKIYIPHSQLTVSMLFDSVLLSYGHKL